MQRADVCATIQFNVKWIVQLYSFLEIAPGPELYQRLSENDDRNLEVSRRPAVKLRSSKVLNQLYAEGIDGKL